MFENEAKGWYGSYSNAGRTSAEQFHVIVHKDELLNAENKRFKLKDIFSPDDPKQLKNIEDNLEVFKIYNSEGKILNDLKRRNFSIKETNVVKRPKLYSDEKYKYHNKNKANSKNKIHIADPGCTRYHPRYDYIWPRLLTGPKWKKQLARPELFHFDKDDRDFYDVSKKAQAPIMLVNMDKTTQRGEFGKINDIRIRTDKPFVKVKSQTTYGKKLRDLDIDLNDSSKKGKSLYIPQNPADLKDKFDVNDQQHFAKSAQKPKVILNNSSTISVRSTKSKKMRNIKKSLFPNSLFNTKYSKTSKTICNIPSFNNSKSKTIFSPSEIDNRKYDILNKHVASPIFDKTISREKVEKIKGIKPNMIPYVLPNYSLVRERNLTMAVYKKDKPQRRKPKIVPLDPEQIFDPNKVIDKYNNHATCKTPNFKNMTSRPNRRDCALPSYMQQIHDRSNAIIITDKALQMNKFSDGKFMSASTSFWPKRSYNSIINLNFINSKKFKEKDNDDAIEDKKNMLKNSINLLHKNFEELIKEGALNKFDNITLKSVKRDMGHSGKKIFDDAIFHFGN